MEIITQKSEALNQLNQKLTVLKQRAESIVVKDQPTFVEAAQVKLDLQAYQKAVKFQTGPEIETLKEQLRRAQSEEKMLLDPATAIIDGLETQRRQWAAEERRKAEEEQRRINEEARVKAAAEAEADRKLREKAAELERKEREKEIEKQRAAGEIKAKEAARLKKEAEEAEKREKARAEFDAVQAKVNVPQVTVKTSIPTVPGLKNQVYWKFRIVNAALIPVNFRMPDEVAIGRMVRDTKDKKLAEAQCPGIEVYSE